jgi:hypothetical protein
MSSTRFGRCHQVRSQAVLISLRADARNKHDPSVADDLGADEGGALGQRLRDDFADDYLS